MRSCSTKQNPGSIDIYFEGDSITRRWGATDYPELLANWKQNFSGWNAANCSWVADQIENILWRLNNGELDGIRPKIMVLLAGTDNIGNSMPAGSDEARRLPLSASRPPGPSCRSDALRSAGRAADQVP